MSQTRLATSDGGMSSDGESPKKESTNNAFTSAVIHASVNKDTLVKQQEKEKQQKQLAE